VPLLNYVEAALLRSLRLWSQAKPVFIRETQEIRSGNGLHTRAKIALPAAWVQWWYDHSWLQRTELPGLFYAFVDL